MRYLGLHPELIALLEARDAEEQILYERQKAFEAQQATVKRCLRQIEEWHHIKLSAAIRFCDALVKR